MGRKIDNRPDVLPEERTCPVTGDVIDLSPARGGRKIKKDFAAYPNLPEHDENCDFCPGHEERTPDPETIRIPFDGGPWGKRVVPNLWPIKMIEKGKVITGRSPYFLQFMTTAEGTHDVLIETPLHNGCLSRLSIKEISSIALAIAWRHDALATNPDYAYFDAFKNYGAQAGATLEHPHTQLEASRTIPPDIAKIINRFEESFRSGEGCLFCDNLFLASREEGLVVAETPHFISFVPIASKGFCETWITPKYHSPSFSVCLSTNEKVRLEYAVMMLDSVLRIKRVIQDTMSETPVFNSAWADPPYRGFLYTAPFRGENGKKDHSFFHWWWVFRPVLKGRGAREEFTGVEVETSSPERAAELLRNAEITIPELVGV